MLVPVPCIAQGCQQGRDGSTTVSVLTSGNKVENWLFQDCSESFTDQSTRTREADLIVLVVPGRVIRVVAPASQTTSSNLPMRVVACVVRVETVLHIWDQHVRIETLM
jgi:hypothetical protein